MICVRQRKLIAGAVAVLLASSDVVGQAPAPAPEGAAQPSLSARLGVAAFPAKGQSATQQASDENQCFSWAKTQSGIDPFALQASQPAPPPPNQQAVASAGQGSAVRGAAGGAAIGAIAGNAGTGAAAGAAAGLIKRRRDQKQAAAQQQTQQESSSAASSAALAQARATYNKAFAACLEGKGYTVR
jgi:hypothetical protein